MCWIARTYLNAYAPGHSIGRLIEIAIVSPDLVVFSSLVEHRHVLSSCIHLVALRTYVLKLKSSTLLLDSSPFLCSFNPSRTVHQKITYATISYPPPPDPVTQQYSLSLSQRSRSSPCSFMSYARYRRRPRTYHLGSYSPAPRMDALARTHAQTRIDMWLLAAFAPFFGAPVSLSILLSSPCIRLRLWPIPRSLLPIAARVQPVIVHPRARASTPRAGHQHHPSCSNNTKHLITATPTPLPTPRVPTPPPPTLPSAYPPPVASIDPISEFIFRILILLSVLAFLDLLAVSISVFSFSRGSTV